MADGNDRRAAGPAVAVLAVALVLGSAGAAEASCGKGNRVNHRDAECLSASWNNRGVLRKSPYRVRNMCPEYGSVVAKVDLASAMDRTLRLDDGESRDGSTIHRIRGISCCSDTGELCNRSDVLTDAGCLARFRQVSSAARTCRSATATYSGETRTCTIAAECLQADPKVVLFPYMPTGIVIPFPELDEVHNCGGLLRRGPCDSALQGTTTVSVSDARVRETQGASLEFAITLSRVHPKSLTVGYSTGDGTARAGADYRRTAGILTLWSGQTRKTVSVPVLDDELAEGPETLKLKVWIARGWPVHLANPVATGTIVNTDRMPKAWIARFGRTVADQVLDALDARMRATPAPGAEVRLAGQRIDLAPPFGARSGGDALSGDARTREAEFGRQPGEGGPPESGQADPGHALLAGTSFSTTAETAGRSFVSIWGRGAVTRFSGRDDGLRLDGEAATAARIPGR